VSSTAADVVYALLALFGLALVWLARNAIAVRDRLARAEEWIRLHNGRRQR
jgi:hypothetical protein